MIHHCSIHVAVFVKTYSGTNAWTFYNVMHTHSHISNGHPEQITELNTLMVGHHLQINYYLSLENLRQQAFYTMKTLKLVDLL